MSSNIQLTIQLDCSERLEKVLTSIAEGLSNFSTQSAPTPRTRKARQSASTETKQADAENVEQREAKVEDTQEVEKPTKEKPAPEETVAKQEAPAAQVSEITNADLRKAMNDCRVRVLGDKANDGILRSTLNDKLRDKVHELGCQSSTDLSQEQRVIFVKFCEEIPAMQTEEDPF